MRTTIIGTVILLISPGSTSVALAQQGNLPAPTAQIYAELLSNLPDIYSDHQVALDPRRVEVDTDEAPGRSIWAPGMMASVRSPIIASVISEMSNVRLCEETIKRDVCLNDTNVVHVALGRVRQKGGHFTVEAHFTTAKGDRFAFTAYNYTFVRSGGSIAFERHQLALTGHGRRD